MIERTKDYGRGIGPFKPIEGASFNVNLRDGGIDKAASAAQINEGGSPASTDVRFAGGGIVADYGQSLFGSAYAGAGDKTVIHLAPYEKEDKTKFLMRCRPNGWDRWNGANWLTLPGVLTPLFADRVYSTIQDNKFIVANGIDRLKQWDGDDTHAVQDLDPDAPIAYYVTRIGTRLLTARLRVGGTLFPNQLAWSADGNIYEWLDPLLGAGGAAPFPEGSGKKANYITGLSTLARGAVIYRQAAITLGLLTGQGAAPFRFTTVDFSHGTESPYSIASGGMEIGDFFLGSDYMPYIFSGDSVPVPIGIPIHDELLRTIPDLTQVVGALDTNEQEYWLGVPTVSGSTTLVTAWIFNIRDWVSRQKMVWRKRTLPANTKSIGFGLVLATADPIVDTVGAIVDTDATRVDDYGRNTGPERVMFGDDVGQVRYTDKAIALVSGSWVSKQFNHPQGHKLYLDRTRIKHTSQAGGQVAVSVSNDGGLSFSTEKFLTVPASGVGPAYIGTDHGVTGRGFLIRVRPTNGFVTVSEMEVTFQDLGSGND